MRFILGFSGEHPTLPKAELDAVLEGDGFRYRIAEEFGVKNLVLVEVDSDSLQFVHRLALTTKACEYAGEGEDLSTLAEEVYERISGCESFVVRCKSEKLEKRFGGLLHDKGLSVSLRDAEVEVSLFKVGERCVAGLDLPLKRDFNARRAQHRPFFSPTSMHPKLARVMVNLARVKRGDIVLDPFCGTGGILIEAGLIGMKLVGWDISDKMVSGCMQNLRHYGLAGDVREMDALKGKARVDAIVTDPPYGRASYTSDRKISRLYNDFLAKARHLVEDGGYVVLMIPQNQAINTSGFEVQGSYDIKVHKSLTRRIWVLKNAT